MPGNCRHGECQGCIHAARWRHRSGPKAGHDRCDGRDPLAILRGLSAGDPALPHQTGARSEQVPRRHRQNIVHVIDVMPEDQGARRMNSVSRRDVLQMTVAGLAATGGHIAHASPETGLASIAAKNGFLFGAAAAEVIDKDPAYRKLYTTQTAIITTDIALKM